MLHEHENGYGHRHGKGMVVDMDKDMIMDTGGDMDIEHRVLNTFWPRHL
jgi:hypothetical protein